MIHLFKSFDNETKTSAKCYQDDIIIHQGHTNTVLNLVQRLCWMKQYSLRFFIKMNITLHYLCHDLQIAFHKLS